LKGVSTLIQLIFRTEDPEWIEDLSRIEGMALELNWKTKGGGYSNEILNLPGRIEAGACFGALSKHARLK
jgi:hypothetical protein